MSATQSYEYWKSLASKVQPETRAWIGGKYQDALSGLTFPDNSPVDGRFLGAIAKCGTEDVEQAVQAARHSYDSNSWASQSPAERKAVLFHLADLILEHREELAVLDSLDCGKPVGLAINSDIAGSAGVFRWYAEAIDKLYDLVAPTSPHALGLLRREPIGVIGAIVPWNFALLIAAWKVAPALAAGNSVVLKPSEKSPLTAIRLGQLAAEAGIPDGVLNIVPGFGPETGQALAGHPDVDMITFTGSTAVGKHIMHMAAESNMKQVSLECGGKSPNIIFGDVQDTATAAGAAAMIVNYNAGQVCVSPTRLLLSESIADEFMDHLLAATEKVKPGDPLNPATTYGALIDEAHLERVLSYVESGIEEGATLIYGGQRSNVIEGGVYMGPTIFTNVRNDMKIAREEIFGPVLSVMTFSTEAEAIQIANDSPYGLHACIWSGDMDRINRVSSQLRAGTVTVNTNATFDMSLPVGGFKQSGFGKDRSLMALEKYTQVKTTYIQFQNQ
jgi:acyl-CoA reductase-like NAD-dependent aldehyde dehydrogenase